MAEQEVTSPVVEDTAGSGHEPGVPGDEQGFTAHQQDVTGLTTVLTPRDVPEDILRLIFAECLPKPKVHFVSVPSLNSSTWQPRFTGWWKPGGHGSFQTDYAPISTLSQVCTQAREIVRKARPCPVPVPIELEDGSGVMIDSSTDLVCFDFSRADIEWWRVVYNQVSMLVNTWRNLRKTGVVITNDLWRDVLGYWFEPPGSRLRATIQANELVDELPDMPKYLVSFPKLEEFYIVLPDVTENEWHAYYNKFPIAFHDRDGSYVVVDEKPVHESTMYTLGAGEFAVNLDSVWRTELDDELYCHVPHPIPDFAKRMDAQVSPAQRVSLLLGMINHRKPMSMLPHLTEWTTRVLARRPIPSSPAAIVAAESPHDGNAADDEFYAERLNAAYPGLSEAERMKKVEFVNNIHTEMWNAAYPGQSQAEWMKETIHRVFADSEKEYSKDEVARAQESSGKEE